MSDLGKKRIQIFLGHYGSGKTSIAVNAALALRRTGNRVTLADLDIVNPYFRTADSRKALEEAGVELIASRFAGSNLDVPALPAELYGAISGDSYALLDVGGDDRGAVALGRYAPQILERGDYLAAFVVNFYRPLTATAPEAMEVLREVEAACGLKCTALINNSNLGRSTRPEDVLATVERMERLKELSGLPLYCTAVKEELWAELQGRIENIMPLRPGGIAVELKG